MNEAEYEDTKELQSNELRSINLLRTTTNKKMRRDSELWETDSGFDEVGKRQ